MVDKSYRDEIESLLVDVFEPAGYQITQGVTLDPVPESVQYQGLRFSLNDKRIVYRKGKLTSDRPGAFLAVWQRPLSASMHVNKTSDAIKPDKPNKPIPLTVSELDYLLIQVESHSPVSEEHDAITKPSNKLNSKRGLFIFPISILIEKGIVSSPKHKGKTGFRVFPPWSQDRGDVGTKVFSESGKKTQRWQLPFFVAIDDNGSIDAGELNKLLT